ncbi:MAG: hypothetical protein QF893_03210 [Alphaproteobacteria bacterium]|jgi:hypothetical protein|nr:hypothetical protein [Alphaproteobacteria bacterium]
MIEGAIIEITRGRQHVMSAKEAGRDELLIDDVVSRIPTAVRETLSEVQLDAVRTAVGDKRPWRKHLIDIRVTLPLGPLRVFMTLVAGADRRNPDRRAKDRTMHPVRTASNMLFIGTAVVVLYAIAGVVALLAAIAVRG